MKSSSLVALLAAAMLLALSCVCVQGASTPSPTSTSEPQPVEPSPTPTSTSGPDSTQTPQPTSTALPPSPTSTVPPPDTTGPPAPVLVSPINNINPGCVPYVGVVWNSVSDPSGIDHYDVEAQVNHGSGWVAAGDWQASGPIQIPHECGYPHRWRVRAVDGVGNEGAYPAWGYFHSP